MDGYSLFLDPMGNSQRQGDDKLAAFDRETSAKVAKGKASQHLVYPGISCLKHHLAPLLIRRPLFPPAWESVFPLSMNSCLPHLPHSLPSFPFLLPLSHVQRRLPPSPPSAVANGLSETVLLLANEPSLGLYRLQEHVRRSVPTLVELKKELTGVNMAVQGAVHDAEYAVRCVSLSPGRIDRW